MKNFLFLFLILICISCGGNTANYNVTDSANAIDQRQDINDTNVTPLPNGYAPPNDSTDTSRHIKNSNDSLKRSQ